MRRALALVGMVLAPAATAFGGTVTLTLETYPDGSTLVGPVVLTTQFVSEGIVFEATTLAHMQPTPSDAPSSPNTRSASARTHGRPPRLRANSSLSGLSRHPLPTEVRNEIAALDRVR